ncbi:uncharacterized protein LOC109726328 [Ananas comosus]|uniref:Uncharacterized protein LOC109726328 n=1 Tax=Ananas comosus TaxID=4615 RepID=A0A6P5GUC7_ANACO|nr:uncharacterized protein LOC109726328 [Ananas comosus]
MEALFDDIYTLEKDKVHLAAHCFEGSTRLWWTQAKKSHSIDIASMTWEAFRELLLMEYFPKNDKRKIKEDFRKLRQGSRTVREYEKEFTHMINFVPSLVHGDRDRAEAFERRLRPDIFKVIHAFRLKTYEEVLDRALWVERGNAITREERETFEKDKERDKSKKRVSGGSAGQSSSKRPPRSQRSQWRGGKSQTQGHTTYPCVICGGDHRVVTCPQREERCYRCGQAGHIGCECPGGASPARSAASVQYTPQQQAGLPSAMSTGRSSAPRQPKASRAPSGLVFATQVEKQLAVPDDVVAGIILIKGTRARALFDTGASHSFIGVLFAKTRDIEISHNEEYW